MSEEDDRRAWEAEEERKRREAEQPQTREGEAPGALAITVGAAIPAATTIDALFTALFATRSADIAAAGVPTYSWGANNMIIAQWPAIQVGSSPAIPNYSAMFATFHARSDLGHGSLIAQ